MSLAFLVCSPSQHRTFSFFNDSSLSFSSFCHTETSFTMSSRQPFIEDIGVEAAWSGNPSSALKLKITVDVVAEGGSHLSLIRTNHPSVLYAEVVHISKLLADGADVPPSNSSSLHRLSQPEISDSPAQRSTAPTLGGRQDVRPSLRDDQLSSVYVNGESRQNADTTRLTDKVHFALYDQQKSSAERAEIPLFAQTASLYEASSSRGSALSPPPPTSTRLTIPKREGHEPISFRTSDHQSPARQKPNRKDDGSPHSMRKRPMSLDKRPPWRPVGAQDTTPRGRKQLGTDVAKRRISRSTGTVHVSRGRTRQRQSSLPGRMPKTERGSQRLQTAERHDWAQTLPRGRLLRSPMHDGCRDRDATVKVTWYTEALNAGERLEKWLEDRRGDWPAESPLPSDHLSDEDVSFRLQNSHDSSSPALSPSPTPSSRAALPWTSSRGIRGGGSIDQTDSDITKGPPIPTLVEDNGTIFTFFQACNVGECKAARFRIEIHASIKLEAQTAGYHTLAIPDLPLQSGDGEGTFSLRVMGVSSSKNDGFKAFEKVAYVDDDFSTHILQSDQMSYHFRLDMSFKVNLLCFEASQALDSSKFEIDSDVHTRYDWENLDGDGISVEHSMVCSIRLHQFLMWTDSVTLKLYLIGGPSGTIETCLEPGSRRVYLDGKHCEAEHELEMSISCPVADLQKTFIVTWEQALGAVPLETWLPRISGLYRKKLEDVFDLPDEAGISIAPRPCKKSRAYSMEAQERFLRSSGNIFFFPENQHTPRTIQQSLDEESGQFYDELTADGDESSSSASPVGEVWTAPLEPTTLSMKPKKRPRTGDPKFLPIVTDFDHRPPVRREHQAIAETSMPAGDAAEPVGIVSEPTAARRPGSFLIRSSVSSTLNTLLWFLSLLFAPARLFQTLFLVWLCVRAFDPDRVVQLETSIKSKAIDAWNRCDFEPVQLRGDFTGWKHLMAKVNQGAARVIHDGHLGVLGPMDRLYGEVVEMAEDASVVVVEDVMEKVETEAESEAEQVVPVDGKVKGQSRLLVEVGVDEASGHEEKSLTFLDRIDLALGWRPPRGAW